MIYGILHNQDMKLFSDLKKNVTKYKEEIEMSGEIYFWEYPFTKQINLGKELQYWIKKATQNDHVIILDFQTLGNSLYMIIENLDHILQKNITLHILDEELIFNKDNTQLFKIINHLYNTHILKSKQYYEQQKKKKYTNQAPKRKKYKNENPCLIDTKRKLLH